MWGKLLTVLIITTVIGAVTFLGHELLGRYGEARYQAGIADGQLKQMPAILAANAAAAKAGLDARDQQISAEAAHSAELGRLLPEIISWKEREATYAQTDDGRAACLDAERVLGIEAHRAALFPATAAEGAGTGQAGSMLTIGADKTGEQ